MENKQAKTEKPSSYQPSKAELEKDVTIDTTPEELGRALMRGGAPRREPDKTKG